MNEKATRMPLVVGLAAFAAVLASTANAYVPEGAGVPAEIYAASTPVTVLGEQQSQRASVREQLGEIGAWAVPSISQQEPLRSTHPTIPDVDPSTFEGYRG